MATPGTAAAPYFPYTTKLANQNLDVLLPGGRTTPDIPTYLSNNATVNPKDTGAVDNGVADNTSAFTAAITLLNTGAVPGGVIQLVGTSNSNYGIASSLTLPKRVSGDNFAEWYAVRGQGRGAPRILALTGLANLPIINASGTSLATLNYYREITGLYLAGNSIAQVGVDIRYTQHFKLEDLFITGLVSGSGTAGGVRVYGAICAQFRDIKVHNSQGHGIYADDDSANFFNANLIEGCSFLAVTGDGFHGGGGVSGCSFTGNTFESCGSYGIYLAGYSTGGTWIGGNYFEGNVFGDIYLGAATQAKQFTIETNYLNGYTAGVSDSTYTPIKVKFATGCVIRGNEVAQVASGKSPTGYYFLDANIAGGSVTDLRVERNTIPSLVASTPPNQVYNLPGSWVNNRNAVIDDVFAPVLEANLSRGRLPYGGWSLSVAGAGTAARGANVLGAPAIELIRPASGDTASMSQVFPIGPEFQNRFVTVAVPVVDKVGLKSILVAITPNGTSPMATTINTSTIPANGEQIIYAMAFAPSDATQITVSVTPNNSGADFLVGQPCLYVGARQWYNSAGDTYWVATTAPTAGTWNQGDLVFKSNAAASGNTGWVCTVAGTPGTWQPFGYTGPNATISGTLAVTGAFGANGTTPQTAFASGGAAPAGGTGTAAGGWDTAAHRDAAITLLNNIRTALVNAGIMT